MKLKLIAIFVTVLGLLFSNCKIENKINYDQIIESRIINMLLPQILDSINPSNIQMGLLKGRYSKSPCEIYLLDSMLHPIDNFKLTYDSILFKNGILISNIDTLIKGGCKLNIDERIANNIFHIKVANSIKEFDSLKIDKSKIYILLIFSRICLNMTKLEGFFTLFFYFNCKGGQEFLFYFKKEDGKLRIMKSFLIGVA